MNSSVVNERNFSCDVVNAHSSDIMDNKKYVKKGRPNTTAEKKLMRINRKKRLRKRYKEPEVQLKKTQENAESQLTDAEKTVTRLKCMTRTFWERWRWEVEKRKELMLGSTRIGRALHATASPQNLLEIEPSALRPISAGTSPNYYLGRGSFGIVTLQMFRGMQVAVKELHTHASNLCHPFLPYLFGICTKVKPLKIIMQFHGLATDQVSTISVTVFQELSKQQIGVSDSNWISIIGQLLEAVAYLHTKAKILHNDISCSNILLTNSIDNTVTSNKYQIVLIDFGKATKFSLGKQYHLSSKEKQEYFQKFPQLAPEVIEGDCRQTTHSDMYAVGGVIYKITDHKCLSYRKPLLNLAEKCRLVCYMNRMSATRALLYLQENVSY